MGLFGGDGDNKGMIRFFQMLAETASGLGQGMTTSGALGGAVAKMGEEKNAAPENEKLANAKSPNEPDMALPTPVNHPGIDSRTTTETANGKTITTKKLIPKGGTDPYGASPAAETLSVPPSAISQQNNSQYQSTNPGTQVQGANPFYQRLLGQ